VGDEFAGRAVKCPNCGAAISASPGPAPQANSPAPEAVVDAEPATPAAAPNRSDDTPQSSRDRAEESASRERTRRRERGESEQPHTTNRGVGVIVVVIGLLALSCCGVVGYGAYWVFTKVRDAVDQIDDQTKQKNERVTRPNYEKIAGGMTRKEADKVLGEGRTALPEDLATVFRGEAATRARLEEWTPKVRLGRVILWQNRDDYLLVAFYPNADDAGRVQLKAFAAASGAVVQSGTPDDDAFARKYQLPRPDGTPGGSPVAVTAETLIREYVDDSESADRKYRDKLLEVTDGVLERREGDAALVYPAGKKTGPNRVRVSFLPAMGPQLSRHKPGDPITFRGKCEGRAGPHIVVTRGEFAP
jgi:hypothetical protein